MAIFYMDPVNGNDSNSALGWWKIPYTVGNGTQPVAGETLTDTVGGGTAKVISVAVTSGTWAGGDAAGTIYAYGKSGTWDTAHACTGAASTFTSGAGAGNYDCAKTFAGITAAMLNPGDIIRVAKSPDPFSVGLATFTQYSHTVTLDVAQTADVDMCESGWVNSSGGILAVNATPTAGGTGYTIGDILTVTTGGAAGKVQVLTVGASNAVTSIALYAHGHNYTAGAGKATSGGTGTGCTINITTVDTGNGSGSPSYTSSYPKQGTNCMQIAPVTLYGQYKLCYKQLGGGSPIDFSAFQGMSWWQYCPTGTMLTSATLAFCLCSDTIGDVVVDTIVMPANNIGMNRYKQAACVMRNGGGNLGSSIQSIAIYCILALNSTASGPQVGFDDIIAVKSGGLALNTLISTDSAAKDGLASWWPIQSITGTTVTIDSGILCYPAFNTYTKGFCDAGGHLTMYGRTGLSLGLTTSQQNINPTQKAGTAGNPISYIGGWNPVTNLQDGETYLDGVQGSPNGIYVDHAYITLDYLNPFNCYNGLLLTTNHNHLNVPHMRSINNYWYGISGSSLVTFQAFDTFGIIWMDSNWSTGVYYFNSYTSVTTIQSASNNNGYGLSLAYSNHLRIGTIVRADGNAYGINSGPGQSYDVIINRIMSASYNSTCGINLTYLADSIIKKIDACNNNGTSTAYGGLRFYPNCNNVTVGSVVANNNAPYGIAFMCEGGNRVEGGSTSGNSTAGVDAEAIGVCYLSNFTIAEATPFAYVGTSMNKPPLYLTNVTTVSGVQNGLTAYTCSVVPQTTERHTLSGYAWDFNFQASSTRTSMVPLVMPVAQVAVRAGSMVTASLWVKKGATGSVVEGAFDVSNWLNMGLASQPTVSVPDVSGWQQVTLTFTPIRDGVAQFEFQAYPDGATACDIYIDDFAEAQS